MRTLSFSRLAKSLLLVAGLGVSFVSQAATEIKVAFNQSDKHPQYQALTALSEKLEQQTEGRYKLNIYPNELLGAQRAALELVQNGAIQMAIVANPLVENYNKDFIVIGLPYIYDSLEHQQKVFTSGILDDLFAATGRYGFDVLGAYTAGSRSIYTKGSAVNNLEEMKGKKIRVIQSETMRKMLSCMGGIGVPMNQGEVYTAIQQGVLDGAENNEITYADLKQYEVAPYFSRTKHLMVPDLIVTSSYFIASMPKQDQEVLKRLVKESIDHQFDLWRTQVQQAEELAKANNATFVEVDITPFQQSCSKLQQDLITSPVQKALYEKVIELQ
ncbi:TRAP transporter substrate-binding protein [Volucribacter amazonae]|uniref:C4-dicarboxylate ABC transporter n=1 Tax=Volucribacter amazonae TaxID=256731 RepID=A0A9X4PE42_9PAST|nr:TRAP transporter substrate-binding protein [Volucribacter amazonae]MDG6895716.1 C4-dicarboxylate ABC transporter [Volucribacter amazonae]